MTTRSSSAAKTGAASAAPVGLGAWRLGDLEGFLLIDDRDEDRTEIITVLRERSPRNLPVA